jgi:hypothetical protein
MLGVARVQSMKTIALTTLSLILGTTAFAEPPQVQITARYEGFDLFRYAEITEFNKDLAGEVAKKLTLKQHETGNPSGLQPAKKATGNVLTAPQITTRQGQRCQIEIIREVQVPVTPNGEKSVNSGVALDFLPVVKDGKITLSGKSVLRRRLGQDAVQPLGAISFATHETFFSGAVEDGKELTVAVGDGPKDKARIILTARLVNPSGTPAK